jgi:ADP-heptose:LPS heptosyltransferase
VLRDLGLGDFLTGVPALRSLKEAYPDEPLRLAAPQGLAPLARLAGCVDELVGDDGLRGARLAVNLHGRGPQSTARLRAAQPRRLVSFGVSAAWRPDEHEVHRWCRLLRESGIPADPAPERLRIAAPDRPAPDAAHDATLIHPGAASAARRWPPERFAAVAQTERSTGRDVVITAGPGEEALAHAVAHAAGLAPATVLAGHDLEGLAALVAAAGRVVCGDTGVAHLATALGTPSVVLFGPVPPQEWGPPPIDRHVALWAGRRGDPHGDRVDPGLLELDPAEVSLRVASLT